MCENVTTRGISHKCITRPYISSQSNFSEVGGGNETRYVGEMESKYQGNIEQSAQKMSVLPPFTHLGYVAEIFKPLSVSLGEILESRLSPCS